MDEQSSQIISLLRFPLLALVIIAHCENLIADSHPIFRNVFLTFVAIVIPTYAFISGYLFFIKTESFTFEVYKQKLSRRAKTLLVPFLIWNMIPVFASIIVKLLRSLFNNQYSFNLIEYVSSVDWLNLFWDHHYMPEKVYNIFGWPIKYTFTCDGPLWYMRDLIVLCVLTPLIYWYIKKTRLWGILLLSILYVFMIYPYITLQFKTIIFFIIGSYFAINNKPIYPQKYKAVILIATVIFFFAALFDIFKRPFDLFILFACFITAKYYIENCAGSWHFKLINNLGKYAFFAYALHQISMVELIKQEVLKFTSSSILAFIIAPVLTFLVCILIYLIFKKLTPKFLSILVGGRI